MCKFIHVFSLLFCQKANKCLIFHAFIRKNLIVMCFRALVCKTINNLLHLICYHFTLAEQHVAVAKSKLLIIIQMILHITKYMTSY